MTLLLDHMQRLGLIVFLDTMECRGRREAFAVCRLQERIQLTDEEAGALNLERKQLADGRDWFQWAPGATIPARPFEMSSADIEYICRALDSASLVLSRDKWYRALEAQLPAPAEPPAASTNGAGNENSQTALAALAGREH